MKGFLVLEDGEIFAGRWHGGTEQAGEVVFNTSHSGYEEIATDPSYYKQIIVMTAPMQGNYGVSDLVWQSQKIHLRGFVCLELQNSSRDGSWGQRLTSQGVPTLSEIDTRELVIKLRTRGTPWGALVHAAEKSEALRKARQLIEGVRSGPRDWVHEVSCKKMYTVKGTKSNGPRVAVMDYGTKNNILNELAGRCSELAVFPSRSSSEEVLAYKPDGIMLTNGPGDPADVEVATETVKKLLGNKFIFAICMGHQILARALGARTYKLKFGHHGANHPIRDEILGRIYMTSQNHGYAVERDTLPKEVRITHTNLNDQTVAGIHHPGQKCLGVQYHPESRPGPHDAAELFDYFIGQTR